ncbi:hypothetical protein HanPSC8_Chr15g0691751 [Helianthus annuus]|nr:hypothetical protein HanPSC8_Chr15g0691751 [Helianthus annuus]
MFGDNMGGLDNIFSSLVVAVVDRMAAVVELVRVLESCPIEKIYHVHLKNFTRVPQRRRRSHTLVVFL